MDTSDDKINSPKDLSKFDKIKHAYQETLPDKIKRLNDSVQSAQQHPDKEHFTELQNIVHKIGGSAGSYGYKSVSVFCKEMDSEIRRRIELGELGDEAWLASLDDFLSKMQQGFQVSSIIDPQIISSPLKSNSPPFLYIIDEDVKFLDLIMRLKNQFSIIIETECDPKKALERLMLPDFNPNIVIASQIFHTSSLSGLDLIAKVRSKPRSSLIQFGLFLTQDTIENRIKASTLDIKYIFCKPISAHVLLKSMENALKIDHLSSLKVLIVDDDIDFCNYVTLVLSEVGISVRSIQDSTTLFKTLEEFHPNVLLLDFILPKYDGLHVLKTLRQDIAYRNLIVIVVTSSEEEKIRIDAYAENADEILYKPIDKELLQKRIINLSERQKSILELPGSERYTGLENFSALKEAINKCLTSKSLEQHLVLFEIDHSTELQKQGAGTQRNLVVFISNQLQWEVDSHMKCFSYKFIFAVIFDSQSIQTIEKKMNDFFVRIIETQKQLQLTFNCSILPITLDFDNADQVLLAAEQGLSNASIQEPSSIRIFKQVISKSEFVNKKEVVIVDSDKALLKILKNAFESHEMIVKTYSEGGEALKTLQNYSENHLPALVIAERNLPDMDGMDLYVKLKERFRENIPFYVLTVFASDKDISDGIAQGVSEYIVKPFNISLLIQKALKTISKS